MNDLLAQIADLQPATPASRPAGARYMGDYAAAPIPTLRVGFIGAGRRGQHLQQLLARIEGVEIVALCDLVEQRAIEARDGILHAIADERGAAPPAESIQLYTSEEQNHRRMLAEQHLDAVFVIVGWQAHASLCCEIMEAGVHAFVEVPMAMSIADLWRMVESAELHQRHCMMLENANFGRRELLYLNMVREGVIGELVHGEGAYVHDLRFALLDEDRGEAEWRVRHYRERNGNLYPTHGLGPLSQYMNLGRGEDQFSHLVSLSSRALSFDRFVRKNFAEDHEWNQQSFNCGDINSSIIKTQLGNTILLQWDECSLRPYTRHNFIQGTKGILAGFPPRVVAECLGAESHSEWIQGEEMEGIYERFDHPLWKQLGARAEELAGARARDYLMLNRIVTCLREGWALDQNIYEGAYWSSVIELTELSNRYNGIPMSFPDFTRGDWKCTAPLGIHTTVYLSGN